MLLLNRHFQIWTLITLLGLGACAESGNKATTQSAPAVSMPSATVAIQAPAGTYKTDPTHSRLGFAVKHMGLANYVARFAEHSGTITFTPDNLANSSIEMAIQARSIRTDYPGDYTSSHAKSGYASWDEDLARNPKFFDADQHPAIRFQSTQIEASGQNLTISGTLTLLGKTQPLTLNARLTGSLAKHRFTQRGAIGFSATGTFKRSDFGMTHLQGPGLIADEVTLLFDGEFHQQ